MKLEEKQGGGRWYAAPLRVRYQESDQMGVVYHANYLNWFELGRTEMIRQAGFTYRSMEEQGVLLPVIDVTVHYGKPAKYDDPIAVFTSITSFSRLRLNYKYEVRRLTPEDQVKATGQLWESEDELPGELLVTGTTNHVWLNLDWKPIRLDQELPELYNTLADLMIADRKGQKDDA